mgnify:CR=1 FL=1
MLDSDTRRKIDTLRDILVGKIPNPQTQVEQITTGLIYKFMDDMDQESIEMGGEGSFFVGDYEKYAWKNLLDPKLSGVDKVNLYSQAIEDMYLNPSAPQLFRDIFKNAFLPFKDPSTLNMFLKEMNEFHYSHSEKLGDAFEYLISIMGSQGDAGQFRTPRHIIDFIVEIIDPQKNETILDPACGTAGFLISSYKHILKTNTDKKLGDQLSAEDKKKVGENVTGYDISPEMIRLSLVNMYLHGFSTPKIDEYDTLSSEDKWNEYFDVILANPPFFSPKGGIQPHKRFGVESKKAEVLFTSYMLEHLKPNGRAGIIVPEGIIFQTGKAYKELRKQLIENALIGLISLPAGVFQPYSGVKTSILILDKKLSKERDSIFFAEVKNDGFSLGAQRNPVEENDLPVLIEKIKLKINSGHEDGLISKSKESLLKKDYVLNFSVEEENLSKFDFVTLDDVCEIGDGNHSNNYPKNSEMVESGIPFIRSTNIQDFKIRHNDMKFISESKHILLKKGHLKEGDILLTNRGQIGKTAIVSTKYNNANLNSQVAWLRTDKDKLLNKYLLYISISESFQRKIQLQSQGSTLKQLTIKNIKSLEFPLPPLEVQQEIVDELEEYQKIIDGCKQVVENYKPTIDIDPSWETVELGEICTLKTGGTPKSTKKEYYENGTIPWLVSGDIHKEEIFDCEGRITQEGLDSSNAKLLPKDSVMIALNGQGKTRGTVAILRFEATCNQSLVSILPSDEETLLVEYLFVCLSGMYKAIRNLTGDNQRSGLNMPIIKGIKIPLAPISIQKEIVQKVREERKVIEGNKKLIEIYTQKIQDRINKVWGEE